jgi:surfactin synthase thioesterase subunit
VEAARYVARTIDEFFEQKTWSKSPPISFFGHCLGAIVAFEVAKHYTELFDEAKPLENVVIHHLVVSSCKGPTALDEYNKDRYSKKWWMQSDADLMDRAAMLGGVPVILRDKNRRDLLRSFVPCIRADYKALEKYAYEPMERKSVEDRGSVDCPVTSICCKDDKAQQFEDVGRWEEVTDWGSNPGQVNEHYTMVMGGHSWPLLKAKEDALKEFLERLCVLYTHEGHMEAATMEEMGFEEPQEDEEELERTVETFYGVP